MTRRRLCRALLAALLAAVLILPTAVRASPGQFSVALPWLGNAEHYSFFVCGHPRAPTSSSPPGLYPPFVATFPVLRAGSPDFGAHSFGVLTGDIVWSGTAGNWDAVDAQLGTLGMPVRFAVGNHDMTNRALFVARYGPTYYAFTAPDAPHDLFIVLDTELAAEGITGDQLAFLRDTLAQAGARRTFVFMHKLLWVCAGTPYEGLLGRLNNPGAYNLGGNFWREVTPLLRAFGGPVYVFAGDVGISWAMALFYQQDGNLHLIASGVGGASEESYLTVKVSAQSVDLTAHRLDGEPLSRGRLEAYDLAYYAGQ